MWKKKTAASRFTASAPAPAGQEQQTRHQGSSGGGNPPVGRDEHPFPGIIRKRRCHDCSRRTYNYRCEACWAKLREPEALDITPFDEIIG